MIPNKQKASNRQVSPKDPMECRILISATVNSRIGNAAKSMLNPLYSFAESHGHLNPLELMHPSTINVIVHIEQPTKVMITPNRSIITKHTL
jgi:hypothetical protein